METASESDMSPNPPDSPPPTRCRFILFALVALVVAVAAYTLWPRPRLVLYTSPGYTLDGKTVRLQMLAPAGWNMGWSWVSFPPPVEAIVSDRPSERFQWMPAVIRRFLNSGDEFGGSLIVVHAPPGRRSVANGKIYVRSGRLPQNLGGGTYYRAVLELTDHSGYSISYTRTNRAEFEATYRQVCESFKVIELKE